MNIHPRDTPTHSISRMHCQLAPAYVETSEFDLLRDQGNVYAHALIHKGVEVDLNEITGGVHGFDLLATKYGPPVNREMANVSI